MTKREKALVVAIALVLLVMSLGGVHAAGPGESNFGPLQTCKGFSDCNFSKFLELIGKVFKYLVWISVPLATLGIGIGGVYMIWGGVSESERTRGKEIFWDSIVGFVIVVAAFLIVKTILIHLGADPILLKMFADN